MRLSEILVPPVLATVNNCERQEAYYSRNAAGYFGIGSRLEHANLSFPD